MTDETTTTVDIREEVTPPEGMVSTKDLIAALKVVCEARQWCPVVVGFLTDHTPLRFEASRWDYKHQRYEPPILTLCDGAPEFVSKVDIQRAVRAASRAYPDEVANVQTHVLDGFGIGLIKYLDVWAITVTVTSDDLRAAGYQPDDWDDGDPGGNLEALQEAVSEKFQHDISQIYNYGPGERRVVHVNYKPDFRRHRSDVDGTNAVE